MHVPEASAMAVILDKCRVLAEHAPVPAESLQSFALDVRKRIFAAEFKVYNSAPDMS